MTKSVTRAISRQRKKKSELVPAISPVEFTSDGCKIQGRFYSATGRGAHPTLLMIPGWPGNPMDVLGLGCLIARGGIHMMMFNPRGMHQSEGIASFAHTLADIGAALAWLQDASVARRFRVDASRIVLGGHSFGGGLATAYAAQDSSVRRLISISGTDHAAFIREYQSNPELARIFPRFLLSTQAPQGPVRFDYDATIQELIEHQDVYGFCENAERLSDRSILLLGGWEDTEVKVEQNSLPFYRALKRAGANDVTLIVYHDNHRFAHVRERLAGDIRDWVLRG